MWLPYFSWIMLSKTFIFFYCFELNIQEKSVGRNQDTLSYQISLKKKNLTTTKPYMLHIKDDDQK